MKFVVRAAEEVTPDSVLQSSHFSLSRLGDMAESGDSSGKNAVERELRRRRKLDRWRVGSLKKRMRCRDDRLSDLAGH